MLRGARQNNPGAGEHGASAACLASSALAAPAPEGFSCASWLAWKTTERKPCCAPSNKIPSQRVCDIARRGYFRQFDGVPSMCDYSLHVITSRPAKVGDKLISTRFPLTHLCEGQ